MKNRRNYYRVLGVQPDAPHEVIRASYFALMSKLKQHPDLGGDHWNATILNEAYHILSNKDRRARYDVELFKRYTKNPDLADQLEKEPVMSYFCPFCKRPLSRSSAQASGCSNCNSPLRTPDISTGDLERRSIDRIRRSGTIIFYTEWPQKGTKAQVVDLSPKGMRFITKDPLPVHSVIKICSPFLEATAKVVESSKGTRRFAIGVQFLTVSFTDQRGTFVSTSA